MPAIPSGSYFAEGLVITSIRSMALAGICSKKAFSVAPVIPEGLPSMRICTFDDPLKEMLPSISTETEGTLTSNSLAVPPAADRSLPTLKTRRSMSISSVLASSNTIASSRLLIRDCSWMTPASKTMVVRGERENAADFQGS